MLLLARMSVGALFMMTLACCTSASPPPAAASAADVNRRQPGNLCRFLRIEHVANDRDVGSDSVALTLVLTPPGQPGVRSEGLVSAKVLVRKERAVGLQAELEAHPDVLCEPEAGPSVASTAYRVRLPGDR